MSEGFLISKEMPKGVGQSETLQPQCVRWAPPGERLDDMPHLWVREARVDHVENPRVLIGLAQAVRQVV
eukprot:4428190-Pyramimonas_sp.AAC.1